MTMIMNEISCDKRVSVFVIYIQVYTIWFYQLKICRMLRVKPKDNSIWRLKRSNAYVRGIRGPLVSVDAGWSPAINGSMSVSAKIPCMEQHGSVVQAQVKPGYTQPAHAAVPLDRRF